MKNTVLIIFCIIIFFPACQRHQQHQLPANRPNERRAQELDMVRINQGIIALEDSLLNLHVQASNIDFKRNEAGFWYKIEHTTENRLLVQDDIARVAYQLYLLDGTFLEEYTDFRITVGRKEFIPGMDEALFLMRTGESGLFIFPSNLAFGLRGYDNIVPPFTPVMFRITVLNQDS